MRTVAVVLSTFKSIDPAMGPKITMEYMEKLATECGSERGSTSSAGYEEVKAWLNGDTRCSRHERTYATFTPHNTTSFALMSTVVLSIVTNWLVNVTQSDLVCGYSKIRFVTIESIVDSGGTTCLLVTTLYISVQTSSVFCTIGQKS